MRQENHLRLAASITLALARHGALSCELSFYWLVIGIPFWGKFFSGYFYVIKCLPACGSGKRGWGKTLRGACQWWQPLAAIANSAKAGRRLSNKSVYGFGGASDKDYRCWRRYQRKDVLIDSQYLIMALTFSGRESLTLTNWAYCQESVMAPIANLANLPLIANIIGNNNGNVNWTHTMHIFTWHLFA